ncbi:TetR/AcrR family transcriptional regulator [Trichloromonas sp.]|uniref:TetR/AcrR family transcriptional regulator n=1 Tax=Trichloromonas sp. TaxID=3069249 RepID=UPI002A3F625A|nr:helix-turn-helix domain-containing protein [Trichloromonas sp.]
MRGIREAKKQATRQAIIEAAVRLFAEKGFEKTSIEQIARAAGIGKGTIYGYFRAKEEIFLAFCEDEIDYAFAALAEKNDPEAPVLEQLLTLFISQFRFVTRNQEFGRLLMREMALPRSTGRAQSRELNGRYVRGVGEILERARGRGELSGCFDPLTAIGHLYALHLLMLSSWYSGYLQNEAEVTAMLRVLLRQALAGIGAEAEPSRAERELLQQLQERTLAAEH